MDLDGPGRRYDRCAARRAVVSRAAAIVHAVLLDRQAPDELVDAIRRSVESDGDGRVADLHVWLIGPGTYAASITVVAAGRSVQRSTRSGSRATEGWTTCQSKFAVSRIGFD